MSYLKHVTTAIEHGEALADEASDIGDDEIAKLLSAGAAVLTQAFDDALLASDAIPGEQKMMRLARQSLAAIYADITCELEMVLAPVEVARVTPAGHLDIGERTRFRLRRLECFDEAGVAPPTDRLRNALAAYEIAIDAYLLACSDAQGLKERAVHRSQLFRVDLEHAKFRLLARVEPNSAAFKRIKRRTVRTKRARWIASEKTPRGLLGAAVMGVS